MPDAPPIERPIRARSRRGTRARALRNAGVLIGYRLGWWATCKVPEPVARRAFTLIGELAWWRAGRGVRRLADNLARVHPDLSPTDLRALTRAGMRSYLRYWCELFRLPAYSTEQLVQVVRTVGEEHFRAGLADGRGLIVALPHMANWDLAGAWGAVTTDGGMLTVAERLEPVELFDAFVAYRNQLGIDVIALTGGADPFPALADRLRAGGLVSLVADRDISDRGVPVDFFGATATMPAGPAALAVRTGATLLGVTMYYDGPQLVITFNAPITATGRGRPAVIAMTQRLADEFAAAIRAHPADWHMLQRIWRDPPVATSAPAGGDGQSGPATSVSTGRI